MDSESAPSRRPSLRFGEVHVLRGSTGALELTYPLTGGQVVVGRNADAHICLDHETVSRNHAELLCGPFGQWWIHDLGSTNGTYVNGSAVQDRLLRPGDEVRIGRYLLHLKLPETRRPLAPRQTEPRRTPPRALPGAPTTPPPPMVEEPPPIVEKLPPSGPRDDLTTIVQPPLGAPREISAEHLSKTMALRRRLMGIEDPIKRLQAVCEFIVGDGFPTHSALVLRLTDPTRPQALYGPRRRSGSPAIAALSHTVLQALWDSREPVVASNLGETETTAGTLQRDPRRLTLPRMVRPLAVVACPLWDDQERVDALYVELPAPYGTEEWRTLLALIADAYRQAELVWEMKEHVRIAAYVERELEMARHIQDGLVPSSAQVHTLDVAIGYEPSRWVGGDYVDAVPLANGRVLLAIADVCGKGLQAALVAASLHTLVRASHDTLESLPQLAQRMNRYLCSYLPSDSFVTMNCLILDPNTGAVACLNAGHPPPLVIGKNGKVRALQSEVNVAFGLVETSFQVETSTLANDEVLLLYTDGLFELVDPRGRPLGMERFSRHVGRLVTAQPDAPSEALKRGLVDMLDAFRGAQLATDDSTFLIARRLP